MLYTAIKGRTRPTQRLLALTPVALALAASLPASALTIIPTFVSVAPTAQGVINTALAEYSTLFNDPVTVNIRFMGMTSGLGQSSTNFYTIGYAPFMTALRADATSATDTAAMASVALGPNPVTGSASIDVTRAQAAAVGINSLFTPDGITAWDSTISLNFGIMNFSRTGPIDNAKYDLRATVQHEVNEVLGTVSNAGDSATVIRPIDLFRYDAAGARSFGTRFDKAYLSLDGTVNTANGYNNNATGDTGDFDSATIRVQNAFGTPGPTTVQMGIEVAMLDAVGFTLTPVPEPATYAMLLAGLGALSLLSRRRKR